ncbi:MAG: HD domain-containing protein [Candidatus Komeilibacteria bacterium]
MDNRFDLHNRPENAAKQREFSAKTGPERDQLVAAAYGEAELLHADTLDTLAGRAEGQDREQLDLALTLAQRIKAEGGMALVVGGYVRDLALSKFGYQIKPKDLDLEIYGLEFDRLMTILQDYGEPNIVGASFVGIKLNGLDITLPRRDSKTGVGHRGFTVEGDPQMSVKEAGRRRDFTINALALDPFTGQIIDHYGGLEDIKRKMVRAIDARSFSEDSIRVLRAAQFAGRFNFTVEEQTAELCRSLPLDDLPKERIGEEWLKLLMKSPRPSIGLEQARDLKIIEKLHPELQALIGLPQNPEWHPEGDVWTHTLMTVDEAAQIVQRENLDEDDAQILLLAGLCHDTGKATTTAVDERGRVISHSHTEEGVQPTVNFLRSLNIKEKNIAKIVPLVREHMFPQVQSNFTNRALGRLSRRLGETSIQMLVWLAEADMHGRALPWKGFSSGDELLAQAKALNINEAKPIRLITGKDLINQGVPGNPEMGRILEELEGAQLEGKFTTKEEGLEYYWQHLAK